MHPYMDYASIYASNLHRGSTLSIELHQEQAFPHMGLGGAFQIQTTAEVYVHLW